MGCQKISKSFRRYIEEDTKDEINLLERRLFHPLFLSCYLQKIIRLLIYRKAPLKNTLIKYFVFLLYIHHFEDAGFIIIENNFQFNKKEEVIRNLLLSNIYFPLPGPMRRAMSALLLESVSEVTVKVRLVGTGCFLPPFGIFTYTGTVAVFPASTSMTLCCS